MSLLALHCKILCYPALLYSHHSLLCHCQTCSNVPHSVATSSSDMYSSDTEAIDYFGSDNGINTMSGSSDDEQGVDTSHSAEDMIDDNLTEILQSIHRNADNMSLMAQELCQALGIDIDSLSDTLYDQDMSPP
ncbi:hypothetical protein BJY52DRAFT_1191905 [Lactarius psammicola]|nr:hypothetical protein BJY52DRAFT_1191905 [Lactarius psammicola]